MRAFLLLILFSFVKITSAATYAVFVSFSIPEKHLIEIMKESVRLHISVYIKGLYQNSMPDTAKKLMHLQKSVPNLQLLIDPTLFERYHIQKVPALVVEKDKRFDVIYGNLSLQEGVSRIADSGDTKLSKVDVEKFLHD